MFYLKYSPLIVWCLVLLVLALIPIWASKDWHLIVISQVGITIIFSMSFNQLLGQTGLLSLGHSIFMGAGSYFSGLILLKVNNGDMYISLSILPLIGGVAGFIFAGIIGYFTVQRSGMIFAILTLAILEFVNSFSISFPSILGGMAVDRTLNTSFFNIDYGSKRSVCFIVMAWLFITLYICYYFLKTPLGKMCNAVRENSFRTEYIGYSSYMIRYLSFCFSGFIAGIAGTLFVINYELRDYTITNSSTASSSIIDSSGKNAFINFINNLKYYDLNSFLNPSDGTEISYQNIISPSTNSNGSFMKNFIVHRKFIPIDQSIFSIQTKLGNISSLENKEILNDNKFSLGGSWLRGFDSYGAGPRNSYTSYQGGNNLIVTKLDFDRPINKISDNPVYLTIFSDVGKVWGNKTNPTSSSESIRSSYGYGIKWYSPIGPLGFSWAFPLQDEDYDIKRSFLFSIGNIN